MNEVTPRQRNLARRPASSFRAFLQEELAARCRANPSYSLRAFARSLRIEPSSLSQILGGKRPITEKMKLRLGSALGLSVAQLDRLPSEDTINQTSFQNLSLDTFAVISDWYHYAILELTYLDDFKPDAAWIGQRLGITKSEVNIAVERLVRLNLLEFGKDGSWRDRSANGRLSHLNPKLSSQSARNYQGQLLALSKRSLEQDAFELRSHSSATLCFDPDDLPAATEAITKFRRKFARDFQPKGRAKEVYQLQISFFPLTSRKEKS